MAWKSYVVSCRRAARFSFCDIRNRVCCRIEKKYLFSPMSVVLLSWLLSTAACESTHRKHMLHRREDISQFLWSDKLILAEKMSATSMFRSRCVPLSSCAHRRDIKGAMWFEVSLGGVFIRVRNFGSANCRKEELPTPKLENSLKPVFKENNCDWRHFSKCQRSE